MFSLTCHCGVLLHFIPSHRAFFLTSNLLTACYSPLLTWIDHFAYGSYSYVVVGFSGVDYDILAESVWNGRVFFVKEATNKRYPRDYA
ncbi:hypothetical protein ACSQ67_018994 [Phaseolus vulgaris]